MSAAEGRERVIAHDQRICSSSKHSAVVDTSAVDSPIIQKQQDKSINCCEFFYFGVSLAQKLSHFLVLLRNY